MALWSSQYVTTYNQTPDLASTKSDREEFGVAEQSSRDGLPIVTGRAEQLDRVQSCLQHSIAGEEQKARTIEPTRVAS